MKKILSIIFIACQFTVYSQLEPDDIEILRLSLGNITDYPSNWGSNSELNIITMNNVSKINFNKSIVFVNNHSAIGTIACIRYIDEYIELDFSGSMLVLDPVGDKVNGKVEVERSEYERILLKYYQTLLDNLLATDPHAIVITKVENVPSELHPRPNPQPLFIAKIKVWYKKCVEWKNDVVYR